MGGPGFLAPIIILFVLNTQWRIQDFPDGSKNPKGVGGALTFYCAQFPPKGMNKENPEPMRRFDSAEEGADDLR